MARIAVMGAGHIGSTLGDIWIALAIQQKMARGLAFKVLQR